MEEMDAQEYEYVDEVEFIGMCQFRSQLRPLEAHDIESGYLFTDEFLREQDAYVPTFSWGERLEVGQKVTIQLEGLECDDLERMDYMAVVEF